jgi:hypothetical protein
MQKTRVVFALVGCLASIAAWASDEVTDAATSAYVPYRAALFRTNSNAQAESEQAIAEARRQWQAFADRYLERRPAPYDRDPDFAATVREVEKVYQAAETEIRAKLLPRAHETLEKARDLLAELRRRNGVITYSDHMNAYHSQMEHVLVDGPKLLGEPNGALLLMAQVGALEYLAHGLRAEAPRAVAADAEFPGSVQAVEASVSALKSAVLSQDQVRIREALGKLKGPYSRLFLKYG